MSIEYFLSLQEYGIFIFISISLVLLFLYFMFGRFLNKLNYVLYGKHSILAWIPFFNIYLLGKLTINRFMGLLLAILNIIPNILWYEKKCLNGYCINNTMFLLPDDVNLIITLITLITIVLLYIYAHFKYKKVLTSLDMVRTYLNNKEKNNNSAIKKQVENDSIQEKSKEEINKKKVSFNNTLEGFVPVSEDEMMKKLDNKLDISLNNNDLKKNSEEEKEDNNISNDEIPKKKFLDINRSNEKNNTFLLNDDNNKK